MPSLTSVASSGPVVRRLTTVLAGALVVLLVVVVLGLELVGVVWPVLLAGGITLAGVAAYFFHGLPRLYLGFLGLILLGYAVFSRGFAYLGYPPVFVGEVALVLGIAVLLLRGSLVVLARAPFVWVLIAFMAVGAAATLPYVGSYGVNALRDAAIWGYAVFALVVAGLLHGEDEVRRVVGWYRRVLPWLMVGPVVVLALIVALGDGAPRMPFSGVPLLYFKPGDVAVHLAGVLGFVVLGLHRAFDDRRPASALTPEWVWWVLWLAAWVSALSMRAAFVTVLLAAGVVFLLRPMGRWWRLLVVAGVLLLAAFALDLEVTVGRAERPISARSILVMAESIFEPVGAGILDTSRSWRLAWWSDILGYTLWGDHFWTGKGYGINLASADGYQVLAGEALRSPHSGHLTFLARSGVPGAAMWLLVNALLAWSLFSTYLRRRAEGRTTWAHVNLWLLGYWVAFMVNAAFDVYLEGPMGGIWFWSLVGFAISALRVQRSLPPAERTLEPSLAD